MKLSIIIPVFNEEKHIERVLKEITSFKASGWKTEIIVIDDGSKDQSLSIINRFKKRVHIITYQKNQGKGFAVRQGIQNATGDFILIQDSDLEYDPKDIPKMLEKTKYTLAVYGSRFLGSISNMSKTHKLGNQILSLLTRLLYDQNITDMETGYKLVATHILQDLNLQSNDFKIEPEITIKLFKKGIQITEVPIEYTGRHKEEKKISVKDGLMAAWFLIKNKF
jgi:glycosyltransferase involved in cell wall biosynthesis